MISTIPLPVLVERIEDAPADLVGLTRSLRCASVLNLNLGFDRPCPQPYHWIYFPEARFPFYRVGVYSNLCPASTPVGTSSFYVEISHRPEEPLDVEQLTTMSSELLREVGLVPAAARLVVSRAVHIPYAYVVHDRARSAALGPIARMLEDRGIASVGRYGAWEYSAMEDALWHGRAAALQLTGRS
jgi:hypothetical protein